MKRKFLAALLAAGVVLPASGQTYHDSGSTVVRGVTPLVGCSPSGVCAGPVSSINPMPVSGTFSATLSGFAPSGSYAQLTVGASSASVGLPSGTVVVVYNTGSNGAFVKLGSSSVAATAAGDWIPAGGWMAFTVGGNTFLAAIETAGATSLNISGGSGLPTGACCASSGGGGGSNASVGSTGSPAPSSATYNGMLVSGGAMVGASGSAWGSAPTGLNVFGVNANVLSAVLPSGAATAANQTAAQTTTGSSVPASAQYVGAVSGGNLTGVIQGDTTTNINLLTSTTGTALVNGVSGKKIYVTAYEFIASGATNFSFGYSTSTSCTSIITLAGPWPLAAQAGESLGGGLGPVIVVPAGDTLCEVSTLSVAVGGHLLTTQF
jgi:hypothetical protein